jgi:MFS family permease
MISLAPLKVLKNTEFRNCILGRLALVFSFRMLGGLMGWWVYLLTSSAWAIGLIGLAEVVPAVGMALFAGHVVDRQEKKRLLLLCNYAYAFLVSLLIILAFWGQSWGLSNDQICYGIYGVVFFTGFARAFIAPLVPSMIPKIVSKEEMPLALNLNQSTFLTASVLGHAACGFVIYWLGISGCLLCILGLMLLASIFFFQLNQQPSEITNQADINIWQSIGEGLQYIRNTREILGAMCLDLFAVFFGGAVALLPIFATDILKVGEQGFGLLNAATDIGAMITVFYLSLKPMQKNQGKIMLVAVAGFGLCIIAFALSTWFWLSFALLLMSGLLDGVSVSVRSTILQLKTPAHLRGRVLSVNSVFITSSNELGQFESGFASRLMGLVPSVIFGGTITMLTALVVAKTSPELRKLKY